MLARWVDRLPWWIVVLAVATLGLAPHVPEPHIWEKLKMLAAGTLTRPVDIFDLAMHGAPWLLAGAKIALRLRRRRGLATGSRGQV